MFANAVLGALLATCLPFASCQPAPAPGSVPPAPAAVTPAPAPVASPSSAPAATVALTPEGFNEQECLASLNAFGNNSVAAILEGVYIRDAQAEVSIAPLLELADAETLEVLRAFDAAGSGYTALIPPATVTNTSATDPTDTQVSTFDYFGVNVATLTSEDASAILQAHVIEGTWTYPEIQGELFQPENNFTWTVTSLQGFEWTFRWQLQNSAVNDTEGYIVVVDPTGLLDQDPPLQQPNTNSDKCPGIVYSVGTLVTPDLLEEPALAPAPAPAPAPEAAAPIEEEAGAPAAGAGATGVPAAAPAAPPGPTPDGAGAAAAPAACLAAGLLALGALLM